MTLTENSQKKSEGSLDSRLSQLTNSKLNTAVLKFANEQFEKAQKSRMQFERQWYTNLAFYGGRQYVAWTKNGSGNFAKLHEPPVPPWRVRLISNKIRPIVRTEHAKLNKERPQAFVIPASAEDEDKIAAQAAENIFEHHWRELKLNQTIREATWWMCQTGVGIIKDWYDPTAPGHDGKPGSIITENITPFHMYIVDIMEKDIEHQPFIIHSIPKDPYWVSRNYQVQAKADTTVGGDLLDQKILSAVGVNNTAMQKKVVVKEMWIKPGVTPLFPDGGIITWFGETILTVHGLTEEETWPFSHGDYPFTKLDHIPTGRFYSESIIPDLIPLQKEYNRTRSQIVEIKNRMSKPQWMAMRGSVDVEKWTTEPGQVVFYKPGFTAPELVQPPSLPSYVNEEQDRILRDMDDISAQHEVTKGRTPPGVTAATAIAYLQEEDDSKLSTTISSIEEAVEKIGKHVLSHVQQFWDDQRLVRVLGDEGAFESFYFRGADIRGNTDLRIEAGSATPRSRAAKQAFIMELGKNGWIPPDRVLRYLNMAETGKLYEEVQLDARQAQRENLRMSRGELINVNTWDNHEVHIMEHNNFRKTSRYEKLDDKAKTIIQAHVTMHEMTLMGQMNQMGEAAGGQMMEEPQEPQEGQPSPPSGEPPQGV